MKNALLNFNKNSLAVLERALDCYQDGIHQTLKMYMSGIYGQPKATAQMIVDSEDYKTLLKEIEQINLMRKQIAYQKKLLK